MQVLNKLTTNSTIKTKTNVASKFHTGIASIADKIVKSLPCSTAIKAILSAIPAK